MRAPRQARRRLSISDRGVAGMPAGGIRRHRGVSAELTSRRQIMAIRVCGSSWRQPSSDTGTSGSSAILRRSSSEVSSATARTQSRNFSDRGVVVSYAPPVRPSTSARTMPGRPPSDHFTRPGFISGWSGVRTSAYVLNVAIRHRPATTLVTRQARSPAHAAMLSLSRACRRCDPCRISGAHYAAGSRPQTPPTKRDRVSRPSPATRRPRPCNLCNCSERVYTEM